MALTLLHPVVLSSFKSESSLFRSSVKNTARFGIQRSLRLERRHGFWCAAIEEAPVVATKAPIAVPSMSTPWCVSCIDSGFVFLFLFCALCDRGLGCSGASYSVWLDFKVALAATGFAGTRYPCSLGTRAE